MSHMTKNILIAAVISTLASCGPSLQKTISSTSSATTKKVGCDDSSIKAIAVPNNYSQPNGDAITYKYEYIIKDKSLPTLINIPGGPGGDNIGDIRLSSMGLFNVINIDPRRVGCNYTTEFTIDKLSTQSHLQDIAAVIAHEKLDNYLIFGSSYGTVVATQLVDHLQRGRSLTLPKSVVLEGTVHKHFEEDETPKDYVRLFNESLSYYPGLQEHLRKEKPLGYNNASWLNFIRETMGQLGNSAGVINALFSQSLDIKQVEHQFTVSTGESLRQIAGFSEFLEAIYPSEIGACSEISTELAFEDGQLKLEKQKIDIDCSLYPLSNPYLSSKYQLEIPIYYLQGTLDPQTPLRHAQAHFDTQQSSPFKDFVAIESAGHAAMYYLDDCLDDIWGSIIRLESAKRHVDEFGDCVQENLAQENFSFSNSPSLSSQ